MLKGLVVAALSAAPFTASAGGTSSVLDLYYLSTGVEVDVPGFGSGDDEGDGFGAKGDFAIADNVFITAEYQTAKLDDADEDLRQFRLGAAGDFPMSEQLAVRARLEYVDAELEDTDVEDDGPAAHIGLVLGNGPLTLHGEVGYLKLSDSDGPEFALGAAFALSEIFGFFVDYRLTSLEVDDSGGVELDIDDLRAGVRLQFGTGSARRR